MSGIDHLSEEVWDREKWRQVCFATMGLNGPQSCIKKEFIRGQYFFSIGLLLLQMCMFNCRQFKKRSFFKLRKNCKTHEI